MPSRLGTERRCTDCGRDLAMRVRAPAQAELPREWVCLCLDCPRFGTFTRAEIEHHVTSV